MKKSFSNITAWIVIVVMVFIVGLFYFESIKTERTIPYSKFEQYWINDEVQSIKISEGSLAIEGTLKNREQFVTIVPQNRLNLLFDKYPKNGEVIEIYEEQSNVFAWLQFVPSLIIIVMSLGLWFLFMQQSQGGGSGRGVMNFGKSRARMATQDTKKVTFKEVAGAKEEKEELEEIVDFLKQPRRYIEMGARIPKGVLLFGPPGTGKTLLAKAVAGEAGVPFFSISGSDFVEMFVGVGASRVRDLFDQAKKNSPCIIFIDEIDAVGRHRGAGLGGGHDEREQTLNQLLVEMDGFGVNEGIIIIAATNRPDILDPALLRPGRFDRHVHIGSPNYHTRREILKVHTNNKPLDTSVDLDLLAKKTHGFNGAHLSNIANEAAIFAVRESSPVINSIHFDKAIERVIAGLESKNSKLIEKEKQIVSYHEAGHALVSDLIGICPIQKISIIPRGQALGYVLQLPDEDRYIYTQDELLGKMKILLAGKASEELIFNHKSTGAKDDLKKVTDIANQMVCEYGMSKLGFMTIEGNDKSFMAEQVQKEANALVEDCYKETLKLLSDNINDLHIVSKHLFDNETMTHEELKHLIRKEMC